MKKIFKPFLVLLVIILAVFLLDIGCVFRNVFGVPCLGCGTTRAWINILQGHLVDAFYFHPLFWLTVPLLFIATFKQQHFFKSSKANTWFWVFIAFMYISVYIVRMVLLFPHSAPMDYYSECLLDPLYQLILPKLLGGL